MTDIAVVTGGGGALGSEVARTLVRAGHKVLIADGVHATERLKALQAELGPSVATFGADLSTASGFAQALAHGKSALGGVPCMAALIAGGWRGGAPLHETDDETWNAMMTQNLETVRAALVALLPAMVAEKRGSIVAVGSRAIERPWTSTNAAAYATSKAAVGTLCQTVAAEVLEHGVRVNVVMPSTMDTPANRSAMPKSDPTQWVSLPSAAGVIAFFLSDAAKDISGALVPLYGRA